MYKIDLFKVKNHRFLGHLLLEENVADIRTLENSLKRVWEIWWTDNLFRTAGILKSMCLNTTFKHNMILSDTHCGF